MMLIVNGIYQYERRYATLNKNICHFWDHQRASFPEKIPKQGNLGCPRSGQPKTGKRRNHGYKIVFSWGKGDLKYSQNRKNGIFDRKWLENCIFMIFWPIFACHFYQHDGSWSRLPRMKA